MYLSGSLKNIIVVCVLCCVCMHVLDMTHVWWSEDNMQASALSFDHAGSEIKFKLSDLVAGHRPVTLFFSKFHYTHFR